MYKVGDTERGRYDHDVFDFTENKEIYMFTYNEKKVGVYNMYVQGYVTSTKNRTIYFTVIVTNNKPQCIITPDVLKQ